MVRSQSYAILLEETGEHRDTGIIARIRAKDYCKHQAIGIIPIRGPYTITEIQEESKDRSNKIGVVTLSKDRVTMIGHVTISAPPN